MEENLGFDPLVFNAVRNWDQMSHEQRVQRWRSFDTDRKLDLLSNLKAHQTDEWWAVMPDRDKFWADADWSEKCRILRYLSSNAATLLVLKQMNENQHEEFVNNVDDDDLDELIPQLGPHGQVKLIYGMEDPLEYLRSMDMEDQADVFPLLSPEDRISYWQKSDHEDKIELWGGLAARPEIRDEFFFEMPDEMQKEWVEELDRDELSEVLIWAEPRQRLALWEKDPRTLWKGITPYAQSILLFDLGEDVARSVVDKLNQTELMKVYTAAEPNERTFFLSIVSPERILPFHRAAKTSLSDVVASLLDHNGFRESLSEYDDGLLKRLEKIDEDTISNLELAEQQVPASPKSNISDSDMKERKLALERAQLLRLHVKDFTLVCMRADAALRGNYDPVMETVFDLREQEKIQKELGKIIGEFAKLDSNVSVTDREADNARNDMLLQCPQGTVNCVDNLTQVISAMNFICVLHEEKKYSNVLEAIRACLGGQGRENIPTISTVVIAGRAFQGESSETALVIESVLGKEFDIPNTRRDMVSEEVGAMKDAYPGWIAIMQATRANNGQGDQEALIRAAAPLEKKANKTSLEKFEAEKKAGKIPADKPFLPLRPTYVTPADVMHNHPVWSNVWANHLQRRFGAKFNTEQNQALGKAIEKINEDWMESSMPLLDAEQTIKSALKAGEDSPQIRLTGFDEPLNENSIHKHVRAAKKARTDAVAAGKKKICQEWVPGSLQVYFETEAALKTHQGDTWRFLPIGDVAGDRGLRLDHLNPVDQLQLELVREHIPPIREIELAGTHTPEDTVRIWMAAQVQGLALKGLNNESPLLTWAHHEAVASKCREAIGRLPREDVQERSRLDELVKQHENIAKHKHYQSVATAFSLTPGNFELKSLHDQRLTLSNAAPSFLGLRMKNDARETNIGGKGYLRVSDKNGEIRQNLEGKQTIVFLDHDRLPNKLESKQLVQVTRTAITPVQSHKRTTSDIAIHQGSPSRSTKR